jgi:hypothetical protein
MNFMKVDLPTPQVYPGFRGKTKNQLGGIMKLLTLVALFCCSAAFAAPEMTAATAEKTSTVETAATVDMAQDGMSLRQYCEAHTICASGRRISCTSSGGSCTSREYPHRYVECVGYDFPGYRGGQRRAGDRCP